jgi:threonine synthase
MSGLSQSKAFTVDPAPLAAIRAEFAAGAASEDEVAATIAGTARATGFLPDPHTAVALAVAARFTRPGVPMVTLSTAHPAKFAAAVEAATGHPPPLPDGFAGLMERDESFVVIDNDQARFEDYLLAHAGAVKNEV